MKLMVQRAKSTPNSTPGQFFINPIWKESSDPNKPDTVDYKCCYLEPPKGGFNETKTVHHVTSTNHYDRIPAGSYWVVEHFSQSMLEATGIGTVLWIKNGTDFVTLPSTATIPAGASTQDIVVTPVIDNIIDGNQTVVLRLAETTKYIVASPTTATVTIEDNSPPKVTIKAEETSISEGATSPGKFTVTRTGPKTSDLTVKYGTAGTAKVNVDYQPIAGYPSLVIPTGSSSASIEVTPIDDKLYRGDKTLIAILKSSADYDLGSPDNATMTILENDLPTVSITVTDATAALPSNKGTFKIQRTGITTSPLTVKYAFSGTAKNGINFKKLALTATIPKDSSSVNIVIAPLDDGQAPADKTVTLTLVSSTAYTIGSPKSGMVTILGDTVPTAPIGP